MKSPPLKKVAKQMMLRGFDSVADILYPTHHRPKSVPLRLRQYKTLLAFGQQSCTLAALLKCVRAQASVPAVPGILAGFRFLPESEIWDLKI